MNADNLHHERRVQGSDWAKVHGNYFSDPIVARPYLEAIEGMIRRTDADVVADIGGGTGFILNEISKRFPELRMVNVDSSVVQLGECCDCDIITVNRSAMELRREMLARNDENLLIINRSLLHYFGYEGQASFQRKMRSLLRVDEGMVQQAACFGNEGVKSCMNDLYAIMKTGKWYPTDSEHVKVLEQNGWEVVQAIPGPALDLLSEDLDHRYILGKDVIKAMCDRICVASPKVKGFYELREGGWHSSLPYQIASCLAK